MTIAERIRLIRQQRKMSQTELAEKSGVNLKSLSRYELGNTVPAADVLKAIADALEVTADALLSDDQVGIKDKDLFKKFEQIQEMEDSDTKQMIIRFLDLAIRDSKARQAYAS
jgi:transcriptional regulator with XRE-family HTH domain